MEKLQDLSQSELQELLDNPQRVESMALESDEIQNIQLEREMALASNRSLAEQNLDVKPRLEAEKEVLVERYSQLEAIRETYRQHCSLRDGMVGQVSPEALFSRLQTEGSKTEADSETLADEFLEGSLPLDSFLDAFLSLRSLAHKRRVRIEKLQEILRQRSEGNPSAMTSSAGVSQDPAAAPSPWNQPTTTATTANQQQPNSTAQSCSYPSQPPSASAAGPSGLPYTPYPVSPPNPPPAAAAASGAANPPSQFPPYPGSVESEFFLSATAQCLAALVGFESTTRDADLTVSSADEPSSLRVLGTAVPSTEEGEVKVAGAFVASTAP
ncbi:vacuolar protein sorting-associated protein 37C [Etheostoma cragini]|uniref:vacuolar protein sorting-associated protein 37C n=1 Tax=Etheostoma cragini TaxID=417921 RepID=UPI00155F4639|nr:vacuolar protein sorting-associated protein 37C [Etheostoma cragini]